ncbi:MAG: ABC transporter substrate-binding protein [Candidatus Hydrogenedentes bacterium]|nr:ABC transporter substrate-binding protein [Candidatus Hydrogenedentota bacterium]
MGRIIIFAVCAAALAQTAFAAKPPVFSLAWSEYPSWSAFGVCHETGLINGAAGKLGSIEEKWGVDIELKEAEYDPCIAMYGAGQTDAVCITNMDVLNASLSRPGVAILATSTSYGADACIVSSAIADVKDLKGKKVRGLALSVSEYCFARNLQILGEDPAEYTFVNMDPGAAALAMQQKQADFDAIVVWNPFVLDTLNQRKDCHVLFDSSSIPNEIIDMVVMSESALQKPKGKEFASAVADAFYALNKRMADATTRDDTLIALGEKFSNLDLQSMRKVVQQTKFYATPEEATKLFDSAELKDTMTKVVDFCVKMEIVAKKPVVAFGAGATGNLVFDPAYIAAAAAKP